MNDISRKSNANKIINTLIFQNFKHFEFNYFDYKAELSPKHNRKAVMWWISGNLEVTIKSRFLRIVCMLHERWCVCVFIVPVCVLCCVQTSCCFWSVSRKCSFSSPIDWVRVVSSPCRFLLPLASHMNLAEFVVLWPGWVDAFVFFLR